MISLARRQLRAFSGQRSWLAVIALIGTAQTVLCWRADVLVLAIPSVLAWLFGLSLLDDWLRHQPEDWRPPVPAMQLLGALLLIWCLNVLSFASQFYDPLQQFLPLIGLNGVGLLLWGSRRPRLSGLLSAFAVMVPLQVWGVPYLPKGFYEWMGMVTARAAALLLAMIGQLGATDGIYLQLPHRTVAVTGTCTGLNVMALCLTTILYFQWSFALFTSLRLVIVLATSAVACFMINSIRVAALSLTSHECDDIARLFWCQLNFWHDGFGSLIFSLMSIWLTCWLISIGISAQLPRRIQRLFK